MLRDFESMLEGWSFFFVKRFFAFVFIVPLYLAYFASHLSPDVDLFTRAAVGRLILLLGHAPTVDPFAYTETKQIWHDHELFPGLLFFSVVNRFGDVGIYVLKLVFAFLTLGVVAAGQGIIFRDGSYRNTWFIATALVCVNVWMSTIRAQVITYLSLAVFMYAFLRYRLANRALPLAWLPLLMIVWVNSHGGFVVGIGFVGIFCVAVCVAQRKFVVPVILSAFGCAVAPLFNPYGVSFLGFILEAVVFRPDFIPTNPPHTITEWGAVHFFSGEGLITTIIASLLAIGIWRKPKAVFLEGYAFLALSLYFGLSHVRLLPIFMMVAATYGYPAFEESCRYLRERFPQRYAFLKRGLALAVVLSFPPLALHAVWFVARLPNFKMDYALYPVQALTWLRESRGPGNVLVHYDHGSFMLWMLHPTFKISLDGRYDGVYPISTMNKVFAALNLQHPMQQAALQMLSPDYIFLETSQEEFVRRDTAFPECPLIYTDPKFSILECGRSGEVRPPFVATGGMDEFNWRPRF